MQAEEVSGKVVAGARAQSITEQDCHKVEAGLVVWMQIRDRLRSGFGVCLMSQAWVPSMGCTATSTVEISRIMHAAQFSLFSWGC